MAAILGLILLNLGSALACRYSVRDTGFVDLGEEAYTLVLSGRDLGAQADLYRRIAAASLLDANIVFSVRQDAEAREPTLKLEGAKGRELVVARGEELPKDPPGATALIESIALSPIRAEIQERALNSFAVIVLVEGIQTNENARVGGSLAAAVRDVSRLMITMPKPVKTPPAILRIPVHRQAAERVTLWGLGFDPEPSLDARVAIVFGRGRRLGSPLEGPLITQTSVQERLVIIGQDCECELDRSWMKGPLMPGRWDDARQSMAARSLGFDPENPLVRAEISRIVMRGPGEGQKKKLAGASHTLGYSEISLDESPPVAEQETEVSPPSDASTMPSKKSAPVPDEQGPRFLAWGSGLFLWELVGVAGLAVVGLAAIWWRRVGREQG